MEKFTFTSSGLKPATFQLVTWYPNHYATACFPLWLVIIQNGIDDSVSCLLELPRPLWNILKSSHVNNFQS
jgi:hypothetical protein